MQVRRNFSVTISRFLSRAAFGLVATAGLVQPGFATAIPHQLVFTENSPTNLAVTFDGSTTGITISNTLKDVWDVFVPVDITGNDAGNWVEPENSGLVNTTATNGAGASGTDIEALSDTTAFLPSQFPPVPDGTSVSFGTDASDGVAIQAVWHDLAQTAEAGPAVPEPGTFGVLLLCLTVFFGVFLLHSRRSNEKDISHSEY